MPAAPHTAAAWMVQAGAPLRVVAEVLCHRDIRTTMRYAHLSPESARDAVAVLELAGDSIVTDCDRARLGGSDDEGG